MPSRRQALIDVTTPQGLSLTGPSTGTPPQYLQRAKGLHEICEREYRIANNDTALYTRNGIHSITRIFDIRYFAAGTVLYAANVAIFTNANSNHLTMHRLPPGNTQPDYLFWCGGGNAQKTTTSVVSLWGIAPPPDGFTVALAAQLVKTIENFEGVGWTITGTGDV